MCDGPDSSGRFSLRQLGHQYLARPLSEAALIRLAQSLYEEVVDEVVLGIVFEEHRGAKLGLTALLENGSNCETPSDFDGADETSNSGSRTFPVPSNDGGDEHFQQQYQLPSSATAAAEVLAAAAAALIKRPAECVCPNCQRNMAASRFAPHLEKCMGMGRNSSRLASRRIASSATRQADLVSDDDVDDDDWTAGGGGSERQSDHRGGGSFEGGNGGSLGGNGGGAGGSGTSGNKNGRRRHKKDKNSPKRKKWKNGASSTVVDPAPAHTPGMLDSGGSLPAGTTHPFSIHLNDLGQSSTTTLGPSGVADGAVSSVMTGDATGYLTAGLIPGGTDAIAMTERLSTMCGVVSEHTGKMCTRSLRCPQHSDSQRKNVRAVFLSTSNPQQPLLAGAIGIDSKDNNSSKEMIDVDTWDEQGDSLASLLTAQSHDVPTPGAEASPAESTSTSASSTSSSATAAAAARRPSTGSGSNRSSKPAKSGKANNNKRFKSES